MDTLLSRLGTARRLAQAGGPYLLLELLLPGGTLLALLLFLYRRKGRGIAGRLQRVMAKRYAPIVRELAGQAMLPVDVYRLTRHLEAARCGTDDGMAALGMMPGCAAGCGSAAK
jgi:hypothetical protein